MPAPIAIASSSRSRDVDSFGSPRNGPAGGSGFSYEKTGLAVSYGRADMADVMDYSMASLSTSTDSEATAYPSSRLETTFCRDFTCCGLALDDLHDLLQHYEECHVRFEDDDVMMSDDLDSPSSSASTASTSQPPSPRTSPRAGNSLSTADRLAELKRRAAASMLDNMYDEESSPATSAFDNSVVRSSPSSAAKGKKRSFGSYASGPSAFDASHASLRRSLIDGGFGNAHRLNSPSVYSANSPFSTPDSSMPGTPTMESLDVAGGSDFFGAAVAPAFSSMSLRQQSAASSTDSESHLPSCAPPNLFFPANGNHSHGFPANKRHQAMPGSATSTMAAASASEGHISRPAATLTVDKPYKCQVPGCDKAYKQMNGLKYHRLHGHCNQNNLPMQTATQAAQASVHVQGVRSPLPNPQAVRQSTATPTQAPATPVGTPTSTAPNSPRVQIPTSLPGTPSSTASGPATPASSGATPVNGAPPMPSMPLSENITKPYVCQVGACGKRYKNMNGLRYHYLHSGAHGMLGLQLLHANGGAAGAKVDPKTGMHPNLVMPPGAVALAAATQQQVGNGANAAAAMAAALAAVSNSNSRPGTPQSAQQIQQALAAAAAAQQAKAAAVAHTNNNAGAASNAAAKLMSSSSPTPALAVPANPVSSAAAPMPEPNDAAFRPMAAGAHPGQVA